MIACTYQICFIMIVASFLITGCDLKRKGDKLVLSPLELIDLVREEQKDIRPNLVPEQFQVTSVPNIMDMDTDTDTTECEDSNTLKNRKVWSRWRKWGECSVTCGGGTLLRRRTCVAGRCARGEREEQRRPCARAPCHGGFGATNIHDDGHEIE